MGQEKVPDHQTRSLDLFLEQFRMVALCHDWPAVIDYLDPDYVVDQLEGRFDGDQREFLEQFFGGVDPDRTTVLQYEG
jgi:hypothetical protein